MLQRLLLLPLLSPLLAVLLVAAVNPKPWVKVRLLTWSSPTWPMGGWIAAAAGLGAALSGAGTALALQAQAAAVLPRRQVRRRPEPEEQYSDDATPPQSASAWAGPARSAGDPAPTVSVPFRVIRKGSPTPQAAPAQPTPTAAATSASPASDDWGASLSDEW